MDLLYYILWSNKKTALGGEQGLASPLWVPNPCHILVLLQKSFRSLYLWLHHGKPNFYFIILCLWHRMLEHVCEG